MRLSSVCLLLILSLVCKAQDWNVQLTSGIIQHKEELIQPLSYAGHKLGIGIHHDRILRRGDILSADVLVGGTLLARNSRGNTLDQLTVNLVVNYLKTISNGKWHMGVGLQAYYDYSLYSLNYEYPFWFTQYSLNWSHKVNIGLPWNGKVVAQVSLPLVGVYSRTERDVLYETKEDYEKAYFHQNLTLRSLGTFQSLTGSFIYSFTADGSSRVNIGYRAQYYRYTSPKPISSVYHSIIFILRLNQIK